MMRRVVYAPSFDQGAEDIGVYIEETFGEQARRNFLSDLTDTCLAIASEPKIGLHDHGYATSLLGVVFQVNWIFFEYDQQEVRFLHIIDARRDKPTVRFGEWV
jgi:plasmid stabilization system protein ParE